MRPIAQKKTAYSESHLLNKAYLFHPQYLDCSISSYLFSIVLAIALAHELRTCSRIVKHELHPPNRHIKISSKDWTPLPYQVVSDFRLPGDIYCFHSLDCICVHTYKLQKSQNIQLGFRSSCPINHPSLCIVFSVCIVKFVSASACQVAGLSVCSIRVTSSNHPSHAAAARLHHCSTISFHHHAIYFCHRLNIRFCSFLPISSMPFSESVS
jgi:hypothetical protein